MICSTCGEDTYKAMEIAEWASNSCGYLGHIPEGETVTLCYTCESQWLRFVGDVFSFLRTGLEPEPKDPDAVL